MYIGLKQLRLAKLTWLEEIAIVWLGSVLAVGGQWDSVGSFQGFDETCHVVDHSSSFRFCWKAKHANMHTCKEFAQVCRRAQLMEENPGNIIQCTGVNFQLPFGSTLSSATWYDKYMFDRRLAGADHSREDVSRAVVDGNMKLNARSCGRPAAELVECPELGLFSAGPCSKTPLFRKRRCREHDLTGAHAEALGDEVVVAHRRRRVLLKDASACPYEVCLKATEAVLRGTDKNCVGRWIPASQATERQVRDYWSQQEVAGFVSMRTPRSSLEVTCQTSKEASKEYKRLVKQGRLGGIDCARRQWLHPSHRTIPWDGDCRPTILFIASLEHLALVFLHAFVIFACLTKQTSDNSNGVTLSLV